MDGDFRLARRLEPRGDTQRARFATVVDDALVAWGNGMRMYEEDHWPAQRLNIAMYLGQALHYDLAGQPIIADAEAVEGVRRVLAMISAIADEHAEYVQSRSTSLPSLPHAWRWLSPEDTTGNPPI
jgi:hypothetical protein